MLHHVFPAFKKVGEFVNFQTGLVHAHVTCSSNKHTFVLCCVLPDMVILWIMFMCKCFYEKLHANVHVRYEYARKSKSGMICRSSQAHFKGVGGCVPLFKAVWQSNIILSVFLLRELTKILKISQS